MTKKELKALENKKMHQWFIDEIWNKRPHYSELSSTWLGKFPNKCMFHHLYEKSKYPDLKYEPENIIMITAQEHYEITNGLIPNKLKIIMKIKAKKFGIPV